MKDYSTLVTETTLIFPGAMLFIASAISWTLTSFLQVSRRISKWIQLLQVNYTSAEKQGKIP